MQLPVLFSAESLKMEVCSLLEANGLTHTNLLIVLDPRGWCRAYTLETHYPELRVYQEGISVQTVEITRSDPQAKVMKPSQRTLVDGLLATTGMYELLLVNSAGHITEGSRSNVFFVCGNELVTAPESVVLVGITRQYVLHICSTLGLVICEKALTIPEAKLADAAFITGTTPKVMPIRYLNGQQFNHKHPKLLQIMEVYDLYLRDYIANNRRL
jgi:branched-chain amino acid aminotransferase